MTREDLIALGKDKVRNNSDLMRIYISLFSDRFGYAPNCAGCTFSGDWQKFVSSEKESLTKKNFMETTFKLKRNSSDIVAYKKEGRTFRAYANRAPESFMVDYLTYGTEAEIEHRKKLFSVLPTSISQPSEIKEKKTRKPRTKKK